MTACHKHVWVKVNAPVDHGVAELVEALSMFNGLETIESCEGDDNVPAWVGFWYGNHWDDPWRGLAEFVLGYLAPYLGQKVGDGAGLIIRSTESGRPRGEITVRSGAMPQVVEAVLSLARNSECSDGRSRTAPSDC